MTTRNRQVNAQEAFQDVFDFDDKFEVGKHINLVLMITQTEQAKCTYC